MTNPIQDLLIWIFATVGLTGVFVSGLAALVFLGLFQAEGLILAPTPKCNSKRAAKENKAAIAAVIAREKARTDAKRKHTRPLPKGQSSKKSKVDVSEKDGSRPMNKVR